MEEEMSDEQYYRYEYLWRNKWLTANAKTIEEMAEMLAGAADHLLQLTADGIILENPEPSDDYAFLVTNDEEIARKHDMFDRREYEDELDEEPEYDSDDC
jgi:hypothetical protein